jgi:hypothetical protein
MTGMSDVERATGHAEVDIQHSDVERATGHAEVDVQHSDVEHEKPEDWGWHADLGKQARLGGYICLVVLAIGLTATHYNNAGTVAILLTMGALVIGLIVDARSRRTSWRR